MRSLQVTQVINASIKLAVLLAAFFSWQIKAHENTPWIPPDVEYRWKIYANGFVYGQSPDEAFEAWFLATGNQECVRASTDNSVEGVVTIVTSFMPLVSTCDGSPSGITLQTAREALGNSCTERDYPNGEDVDGDSELDHCHKSTCSEQPADGSDMFLDPGLAGQFACVTEPNGEQCEYGRGTVQDGQYSGFDIFGRTGESCDGGSGDPWIPLIDDELPDPSDPNSPPSDNGDPDCTPIDGTGLNVCSADPNEVCTAVGTGFDCPAGCGTVNGNFICIAEDDGSQADVDPSEGDNDNSDNQEADDPNTAGDEGTHSRLDGLLENTDGIEGLLRGIKGAIDDIPGGGGSGDSLDPPGEDEPHCPSGQFYIGESCISFDKNDRPVNSNLDFTELDQKITDKENEFSQKLTEIQNALKSKFNLNLVGGAYTANTQVIKGVTIDFGLQRLSNLFGFSLWGAVIMFIAAVKSLFILIGGD